MNSNVIYFFRKSDIKVLCVKAKTIVTRVELKIHINNNIVENDFLVSLS